MPVDKLLAIAMLRDILEGIRAEKRTVFHALEESAEAASADRAAMQLVYEKID